ncbi:MAG: hypothetical protein ACYTGL_02655 [Planctomycetota bacterium]
MRRVIALAVAAAATLSLSVAEAGDCGKKVVSCCKPAPKCETTCKVVKCAPAPKCEPVKCAPAPKCCKPAPAPKCAPAPKRCNRSSGLDLGALDIFGLFRNTSHSCQPVAASCSGGAVHADKPAAAPAVEDAPAPPKAPYEDKAPAPAPPKNGKPAPAPAEDKAPAPKAAA